MLKRVLAAILSCLLLSVAGGVRVTAGPQTGKDAELAGKVKAKIAKVGTGSKTQVEVKLKNGTNLKGHIGEISDDYFVVTDKTGNTTKVLYAEVGQVRVNKGLERGVLVAVIVIPVVLILSILAKGN